MSSIHIAWLLTTLLLLGSAEQAQAAPPGKTKPSARKGRSRGPVRRRLSSRKLNSRKGLVDGHYYRWIYEGKRFIVCTNAGEQRGRELTKYLEWTYRAMAMQFDSRHRDRYEKMWEVNFLRWGRPTKRRTRSGADEYLFRRGGKRALGFRNKGTGWSQIVFLPEKRRLSFHRRNVAGRKLLIHYAATEQEAKLIVRAYEPTRVKTAGLKLSRSFFTPDFGILLVDKSATAKRPFFKTLDTAVHETCHYMFEFSSFTKPVWFNEGYCYFLQVSPDRRLIPGGMRFNFLDLISKARKSKSLMPLAQLVAIGHREFRKDPKRETLLYAESWALFSYLNSKASGLQRSFLKFYNEMRAGKDATKAFLGSFDLKRLEKRWLAWCEFQLKRLANKHVELFDNNSDGKADRVIQFSKGYARFIRIDSDYNGRIDFWMERYRSGKPLKRAWDRDGDGKPERWKLSNPAGETIIESRDTNKDGRADRWFYLLKGKVQRARSDRNFDGKPDLWLSFRKGKISSRLFDNDFDGKVDKPRPLKKKPAAKPKTPAAKQKKPPAKPKTPPAKPKTPAAMQKTPAAKPAKSAAQLKNLPAKPGSDS